MHTYKQTAVITSHAHVMRVVLVTGNQQHNVVTTLAPSITMSLVYVPKYTIIQVATSPSINIPNKAPKSQSC